MASTKSGIATMPVDELHVSDQLKQALQGNHILNLEVVFSNYTSTMLLQLDGFDYHCLTELYQLINAHNLNDFLRD